METNYSLVINENVPESYNNSVNTLSQLECSDIQKSGYDSPNRSSEDPKRSCMTEKQSSFVILIWSVFNFICYPHCGTPAIIFALLSRISTHRNDRLTAKFHYKYSLVFNIISTVMCCISFVFSIIISIIYYGYIEKYLQHANNYQHNKD